MSARFPSNHWRQIKTNRPLERIIREIRRPHTRGRSIPGRTFSVDVGRGTTATHREYEVGQAALSRDGNIASRYGGETMLLMAGAGLTTSLGFSWMTVEVDRRLKAAVGYVPYFGQPFFPTFGRDQHGLDGITLPYLAISGSADARPVRGRKANFTKVCISTARKTATGRLRPTDPGTERQLDVANQPFALDDGCASFSCRSNQYGVRL